jgi:putative alpha-1,2-mannosidase
LQVIGDQGDNPNWLMTFEYLLRDTVVASNVFGRRVIEGRDVQFVRVETEHLGPPHPVEVRLGEEITTTTVRNTGHTIAYLAVPAVQHEDTVLVRIAAGDSILEQVNLTLRPVRSPGYIPADGEPESVSKTLEYAYDDWSIAQVARVAGAKEDEQRFLERAGYYRNVFDSTTGFMRGRMLDGSWVTPFNPRFATQKQPEFTEGNAWQYTWSVQHDIRGLMQLMGGREQFVRMLDSLFEQSSDLTGTGAPPDVSGMIGMYAHGNEPSHHIAYLYAYAGQPWKTQEMVSRIMRTMYSAAPDGIIGNEDCGQMSAWFVLSALGFYPVDPVSLTYVVGSPLFDKAVVDLGKGVTLTVNAFGTSDVRKYIRYIERGGRRHERVYLTHDELLEGGILHFTMDSRPDVTFGREEGSLPPSMTPPQAPTTPSGEQR